MDSRPAPQHWCTGCGHMLAPEAFYPDAQGKPDESASICRSCLETSWETGWLVNRPQPRERFPIPPEKACTRCGETKPLERFSPRKTTRDGRTSHCRDCRRADKARYNETHKAERSEYQKRYYQENAEACGQRVRASNAKKPEKYQQIHSDWKKQNVGACRAMAHRRYARARSAGSWTQDDWERLKAQYDWRCLMCGRQEITDGITLCFDHVIPLSLGGWNIISNAQPLCRSCNSIKHRKVVDLRK